MRHPFSQRLIACVAVVLAAVALASPASAQPADEATNPPANDAASDEGPGALGQVPELGPPPKLGQLAGRRIRRVEVVTVGGRWDEPVEIKRVRVGDPLNLEVARRALRELTDSGRYARVLAEAEAEGDGAVLRLKVLPRRIVEDVKVLGAALDSEETLRTAEVHEGGELTAEDLPRIAKRVRQHYQSHGYPRAQVSVDTIDTDEALKVVMVIDVTPGAARVVRSRKFLVTPSIQVPGLEPTLSRYAVHAGDRLDEDRISQADSGLEERMRARGWHRARIEHRVVPLRGGDARLEVLVYAGPLIRLRFEGNHHFDAAQLSASLELEDTEDRTPASLSERIREYYVARGFLDAEVSALERGAPGAAVHQLVFRVRERRPVRVGAREYPCLTGDRSAGDVGSEIDSFISEELPGGGLLNAVDPRVVDATFGPKHTTGARVPPYDLNPWKTYVPEVYERALKHVQDLYRSEGYLSASVGPVEVLRRRCDPRSPPGRCNPIGPRRRPKATCAYDSVGLPLDEPPPDPTLTCVADHARGVSCEPEVVLVIPIKRGPQTILYDVAFDGNRVLVESQLEELAELELGEPVSQLELEKARRRLLDAYAEEGFAFADVDVMLDLSPDHTRGRVRFIISERERVRVSNIVIRGARRTNESLIRSRIALEVGELYRRSDVRKTEERLALLGVFSTVTVGLEDPHVPAREKVVIVNLVERKPQYLDVRPGFSTGEGFRITFEYGHRNLVGEAISLTLRVQLGYLPSAFIFEDDVRKKYDELTIGQRLERRNTATVEFPNIGLGPLFRLSVEGVDVRDNARDFGLTKDAGIVTLIFRPERRIAAQFGVSLELNDATIFGNEQKNALDQYIQNNPERINTFRVPQGTTVAVAERLGITWDRRDNPLGATRGTLVAAGVEHVRATPVGEESTAESGETGVFAPTTSQFLRWTNRLAGYVRLDSDGLALAGSFRWGFNQQLFAESRTYPDRLFFVGGIDSIRGYLQDSLVPQDIADQLLDPASGLRLEQVVIRGGDVFLNPRLELRIPLGGPVQTALFVDAGNVWTDPDLMDPLRLRYATGSGIRVATPIGPLVFDYGFNLHRVLSSIFPGDFADRSWEDLGAFHFSIGLF